MAILERLSFCLIRKISFILIIASLVSCSNKKSILVSTIEEFNEAVLSVKPGEKIVLASRGNWRDVELTFKAQGTAEKPITLTVEQPGKTMLSGQSNLQISGEYLVVSDLVFKHGFTPTSEVIAFRTSKNDLANHVRVTNCVIDNYTNPERFDGDTWVAIYGKNNRFDHNTLTRKGNRGVTLVVKLATEESRDNAHVIEYNYFGPRQVLGSNGGETLRIGTSHYSRTYSNTIVRKNYFDRCNGEHEIVSNKSCGNIFEDNVFYECQGTLTMRHGHHTLVKNNYFLGNRKPNTGGVRIINEYQTVKKNYMSELTGHRFRGALVIMNGVPNSPINRYNQVIDSYMDSNIVINSDYIQLCAGSDKERSAVPIASTFRDNMILGNTNPNPFTIYDDVSGISFSGNIMSEDAKPPFKNGFETTSFKVSKNEHGLLSPPQELIDKIRFGEVKLPVTKDSTGADYYAKNKYVKTSKEQETIIVRPGTNTILDALEKSKSGDVLELKNGGKYLLTKYANIRHPISITSPKGEKAQMLSEKQNFFRIQNGGALFLNNIHIDGAESPDQAGNNVISTSKYSMNENYAIVIKNCKVTNLDKNHSFDFIKSYKHTFADSIIVSNTMMKNITGSIMTLDMEVEDLGIYNAENISITNSVFHDIQGAILNVYRGGTDESTFGPIIHISNVEIYNSGKGKRNKTDAVLRFHGVQKLHVNNVTISNSRGIDLFMTNGEPITKLSNIAFVNSVGLKTNNSNYKAINIISTKND